MPKRVYGWNKDGEYASFIGHLPEGYSITDPNAETAEAPKRKNRAVKGQTEDDVSSGVTDTEQGD